jgi:DNA-binding transcriptional LysR family regulator
MSHPRISLDHWNILVSVVESGSYAKASERVHRSQSTLSYAVHKIERNLGVRVFELRGRRANLTSAGQLLYRRGKALLEEASRLEQVAAQLAKGWEAEIRIAVDVVFPTWLLLGSLAEFAAERPATRIELHETTLAGHEEALLERRVDIAIGGVVPAGFVGEPLMPVRFVCAAAPSHPLHQHGQKLTLDDLRRHRHLVLRDSSAQRARAAGWLNETRWTVSHKATSIRAATMGLGYAWYPEDSVREELESGALRPLPLREGAERVATLHLIYADRDAAGPGTQRLAQILRDAVRKSCAAERARQGRPDTPAAAPGSP